MEFPRMAVVAAEPRPKPCVMSISLGLSRVSGPIRPIWRSLAILTLPTAVCHVHSAFVSSVPLSNVLCVPVFTSPTALCPPPRAYEGRAHSEPNRTEPGHPTPPTYLIPTGRGSRRIVDAKRSPSQPHPVCDEVRVDKTKKPVSPSTEGTTGDGT